MTGIPAIPGKYQGALKITKRGPGSGRRYLYMMALRFINSDDVAKRWYAKKVKRDGGKKGKAIVALMRKLLAGLWRVGRDGVAFSEFQTERILCARTGRIDGEKQRHLCC